MKELLKQCHNDYNQISDYRDRLAERAKCLPLCPQGKLVSRRNSCSTTRQKKCASDCYILHGSTQNDIVEVFSQKSNAQFHEPSFLHCDDQIEDDIFVKPDVYVIQSKMQSDITELSRKQASDSFTLHQIRQDVTHMRVLFRTIQGTLNSVLARMPTQNAATQVDKP